MEQTLSLKRDQIISLLPSIRNHQELQCPAQIASNIINRGLTMKLSGLPPAFRKENTLWVEGTTYQIASQGLPGSPRYCGDGNVVFGKADPSNNLFCDINFPQEDTKIDPISCIIFYSENNIRVPEMPYYYTDPILFGQNPICEPGYYYIDCSQSGNTGIKLSEADKILLKKGMMIRISNGIVIEVSDISSTGPDNIQYSSANFAPNYYGADPLCANEKTYSWADEEKQNQSLENHTISFKNHKGPFEGVTFKYESRPRSGVEQREFIIGRGGNDIVVDMFFPRDTGVSTKHATITLENGSWYLKDEKSTNLTYILAKNAEQYANKVPSFPQPLFLPKDPSISNSIGNNKSVLGIENYKFYFGLAG